MDIVFEGTKFAHCEIELGDIRIHYVHEGAGPAVVLCHGFPETWYSWRHQIKSLSAAGYRVIAPDLRGFGRSSSPADPARFNIIEVVGDLVGLTEALGLSNATIAGNDWGAIVAWHAALLRPDKFGRVAAMGVPLRTPPPIAPTKTFPRTATEMFYISYFQEPGVAEADLEQDVTMTLAKIYSGLAAREDPGAVLQMMMVSREEGMLAKWPAPRVLPWLTTADLAYCANEFERSGFRGGLNFYRNMDKNWELMKAFSNLQISVPAIFLYGDSTLQAPDMKQVIENMPNLVPKLHAVIPISDCGHWIQQEKPRETTAALLEFLECFGKHRKP